MVLECLEPMTVFPTDMITIPGTGSTEPFVVKVTGGVQLKLRKTAMNLVYLYYELAFRLKAEAGWFFTSKENEDRTKKQSLESICGKIFYLGHLSTSQPENGRKSHGPDREYGVLISLFICRNTSGKFQSIGPTTPAWSTANTVVNGSDYMENLSCVTMFNTLNILTAFISVVGLAGNAIVLWLLGFCMHRNAFSVYVLNLAGADFSYLCFQTVYSLERIYSHIYKSYFYIPIFLFNVLIFTYLAGMCMVVAISAERCLSVMQPIWYRCQRPRHISAVMCTLFWAFSLLLSLLLGEGCGLLLNDFDYSFCRTSSLVTAVFVIALFVVLSGSSLALFVRIFCGSQRIPVTRLYVTITLTALVFILFGLPFGIHWFLLDWIVELHSIFPCNTYEMTTFLSCVNSCANPIIYFLVGSIRHRRFQRKTLKQLLQRAIQDTPEEEEGGGRSSSAKSGGLETVWCSSSVST
ncbi:LOW QUALITY PROTEIN: mas-related G-protein coupled receptor member B4-like [Meriones unguiculatus]|uniref:LOW QUALITY PROTEIN: mas-related G-protein coupled receptor member B4-like n=1 Tax=Meriones unguiculatus TaxID=10047 RepID=UPI000B4F1C48|nr:LOW QUALITY PROTEIN: mas-related G-protein coupled receptor member B4-like [Meriones unguiculatus]